MDWKFKTKIEPFRIKVVEQINLSTVWERERWLKDAHYNVFLLNSDQVIVDFLTDSGTGAMSDRQWAGMMVGDESYAGARSWRKFKEVVQDLTGMPYILPTHQGRAAEKILYTLLGGPGKVFISNTHFDTTRANIEFNGAIGIDLPSPELKNPDSQELFKGNLDIKEAEKVIEEYGKENIAAIVLTITNNSGGGQPVSMKNVIETKKLCQKYHIPLVLDICRIAENSYFIKNYEKGQFEKSYKAIAQEICSYGDACVMSAKKDAIVNIGGFLTVRNKGLAEEAQNLLVITEGFITYGGLAGRDLEAIAIGLQEVFEPDYLEYRVNQTRSFGKMLEDLGIPLITPVGAHAVYVRADALYPEIPAEYFPGQRLVADLYLIGGLRTVEIGSVMFGKKDEKGNFIPATQELVRLAIPRRVYTQSHLEYSAETFEKLLSYKKSLKPKGFKISYEPKFLRHFYCHFEETEI